MSWSEDLALLEVQSNRRVSALRSRDQAKPAALSRNHQEIACRGFPDDEVENTAGNVSQLLDVVSEVIRLETHVSG